MKKSNILKLSFIAILISAVIFTLNFTSVGEYLNVEKIIELSDKVPRNFSSAAILLTIFFVGGALLLPIPLISFATGIIFGLTKGILITFLGLILASISGYMFGRILGLEIFGEKINDKINEFKEIINEKGPIAVAALRVAPTPPFTITSMLAGTLEINIIKYTIASVIGISPLAFSAILFGKGAIQIMQNPSGITVALILSGILLFLIYSISKKKYKEAYT